MRWGEGKPVAPPDSNSDQPDFLMHYQEDQKRDRIRLLAERPHVCKIVALAF